MEISKKIANANNECEGKATTRTTSQHGAPAAKALARKVNRAARRTEKRRALKEQA